MLHEALNSRDPIIRQVVRQAESHEVQILLEYPDPDAEGAGAETAWKRETWRLDPERYFYPASTVKMPTAIVALERLGRPDSVLRPIAERIPLDLDTPFRVEGDSFVTTARREIEWVFAVSDNAAHNRLHELAGRDGVNARMRELGLGPFALAHRLSAPNSGSAEHRGIWFYTDRNDPSSGDSLFMKRPDAAPIDTLDARSMAGLSKGRGYMAGGRKVDGPFDFSAKNHAPLKTLLETLKRVVRPDLATMMGDPAFELSPEDQAFLVRAMQNSPQDVGFDSTFSDTYVKFLVMGDRDGPMPDSLRIANKVGMAYGTVTDVAWVRDETRGIEFFMAATLLVNENEVFNDDTYEYEEIAYPFLAELGRQVIEALAARRTAPEESADAP